MVNFCAVFGCSNRSNRETNKSFYRLPKEVKNQGEDGRILSKLRRDKWLSAINRKDLNPESTHIRICSDHFLSGKKQVISLVIMVELATAQIILLFTFLLMVES